MTHTHNQNDFKTEANTILQQLGGNRFVAMTGAKDFVVDSKNRTLIFRIGRNSKSINIVKIKLTPMDTYDMEFMRQRNLELKTVNKVTNVYAEDLQDIFTNNTGLYTHL